MALVYKILLTGEWEQFERDGVFRGAPIDHQDGYIHLSTGDQLRETANLHFKDKGVIVVAAFDAEGFGESLKYEPSRKGDLFPHQYGVLTQSQVKAVWHLKPAADGTYEFPDEI